MPELNREKKRAAWCLEPAKTINNVEHVNSFYTAVRFITSVHNFTYGMRAMRVALQTASKHQTHSRSPDGGMVS